MLQNIYTEKNTLEAVVDLQRRADAHNWLPPCHQHTSQQRRGLGTQEKSDARRASLIDK